MNSREKEKMLRYAFYCLSGLLALCLIIICVVGLTYARYSRQIDDGFPGKPTSYEVERVIDGDTFIIKGGERVRLYGIDTPEKGEPGYWPSRHFTANVLSDRKVILDRMYKDKYGRTIAIVWAVNERGLIMGISLNELLLLTDNAVVVDKYCTIADVCDKWRQIQEERSRNED